MSDAFSPFISGGSVPWEELGGGIRRQMLGHGDDLMMVRVDFEAGAVGAVHHHPHRQVTYVASGRFEITVGEARRELTTGDCFFAAANIPHGVRATSRGTLIDVFTPARQDFLPSA